jgi:hypothetical protein
MQFKIKEDINIRAWSWLDQNLKNYTSDDVSQSIAYFLNKFNDIPLGEKRIGVVFGMLSFHALCCMLALIKSGRDYVIFYDTAQAEGTTSLHECSHVFFLRKPEEDVLALSSTLNPDSFSIICDAEFESAVSASQARSDLNIEFSDGQRTYIAFTMTKSEIAYTTGKIEASCIQAAMDNYYQEDDVCVFVRPFKHVGVATLAIYPAIFKTKDITLCAGRDDWEQECHRATNTHVAFDMIKDQWSMPKNLRMLTTGGYHFNSNCIDYVTKNATVENIIDCYGTAFCPPPLAIRSLSPENPATPFRWINKYVQMENIKDMLYLKTTDADTFSGVRSEVDGMHYTGDKINGIAPGEFYFLGSARRYVRNLHVRMEDIDFIKLFKKATGIETCSMEFRNIDGVDVPFIKVCAEDKDSADAFIRENSSEITVELL